MSGTLPSAASTRLSRAAPYGPKSVLMCTLVAPASRATAGTTFSGVPRRTTSSPPCWRNWASRSRKLWYRNASRGAPDGRRNASSSTKSATTRSASAAAASAGWSRSRRSRRNHITEVVGPGTWPVSRSACLSGLETCACAREPEANVSESDDLYVGGFEGDTQLDPSETLTGDNTEDPLDAGYSPPDYEPHATRYGTTAEEQWEGESLDQLLAEEEPDVSADDYPVADDYDIEFSAPDPRTGRLVAPDEGTHSDTEADEVADDVGRSGGAASAEEAAVHIIEEE